jgi:GT2 family glycosyltransferase
MQSEVDYLGNFEAVDDDGWVSGWAYSAGAEQAFVTVEIFVDGVSVGTTAADQFRQDLLDAGFGDGNCAFWFRVPDSAATDQLQSIAVRQLNTGVELHNSPQTVRVGALSVGEAANPTNFIPNSGFAHWPTGLQVGVKNRFTETAAGWYVDFKKGLQPKISVSVAQPTDMGLRVGECAMQLQVPEEAGGYLRIVVPLTLQPEKIGTYYFSCAFRRPFRAAGTNLGCGEIFLASLNRQSLVKISAIRKAVNPRGSMRVSRIPVTVDPAALSEAGVGSRFAIVFDLKGTGELVMASPTLSLPGPSRHFHEDVVGQFEDTSIQDQVGSVKLSDIWSSRKLAVPGWGAGSPPRPLASVAARSAPSAIPFVQIIVPIFNAAADVGELIESVIEHTDSPFELILADDHSGEYTKLRGANWIAQDPRVRLFRHEENMGYTRNINLAFQSCVADYIVLINSDTIVSPRWLEKLTTVMMMDDRTAAVGPVSNAASWQSVPMTKTAEGGWAVNMLPPGFSVSDMAQEVEANSSQGTPEFTLLNGFCTLFRRSALEEIGYYDDESFPQGYGEENDLCIRLRKSGWKLRVADDAYVFHKKSKSFGNDRRKELSKKANTIIRAKHPEVDFSEIEEKMRVSPPLNDLRRALREALGVEKFKNVSI